MGAHKESCIYGHCKNNPHWKKRIFTVLSISNPAAASSALTITPVAGGPVAVSAHLVIVQIA